MSTETADASQPLVLIVDDAPENITLLNGLLGSQYRTRVAIDGARALKAATLDPVPDLILLDISIPKIDGWTVARMLKDAPATSNIPLVAVTAHAFQRDRTIASEIGFAEYLPKPVEPRDVMKCVERLIGAPETQAEAAF